VVFVSLCKSEAHRAASLLTSELAGRLVTISTDLVRADARAITCSPSGLASRSVKGVKDSGSFEVRFPDDRPPRFFYWDDVPSRRLRPDTLTSEQALEQARAFARAEGDKGA
jgi:hypothetical protein